MKKVILILQLTLVVACASAQSKYESAIMNGKSMFAKINEPDAYLNIVNYFDRIAQKETDEWLPVYYQARAYAIRGANELDKETKESILNKGLTKVREAGEMSDDSEIDLLEAFIQMLRINYDPATRGPSLSPTVFQTFQTVLTKDPENPRAMLMMGQMMHGSASFFGNSTDDACTQMQKADAIFKAQSEEPSIYPTWGKYMAQGSLSSMCAQ